MESGLTYDAIIQILVQLVEENQVRTNNSRDRTKRSFLLVPGSLVSMPHRGRHIAFTMTGPDQQSVHVEVDHMVAPSGQTRTVLRTRSEGDPAWTQIHQESGPLRPATSLQDYCEKLR